MSRISSKSKSPFDIFGDFRKLELISSEHKLLITSFPGFNRINKDEIKPRYILEVTKENIDYCKNLMKVLDLRHLDNLQGNFLLYKNKYWFLYSANNSHPKGNKEKIDRNKNMDLLLGNNSTPEFVDQQQKFFDTIWDNSIPASVKVKELENSEKGLSNFDNILNSNFRDEVFDPRSNSNIDDLKNTVRIIRHKQQSEHLLLSSVYNASSEVLLTTSSVKYLEHLCKIGLVASLRHAIGQKARIILLYSDYRNKEIFDKDILNLISDIKDHVKLERITGTVGNVLIVDSSKILLLNGEGKEEDDKDEVEASAELKNSDICGVYSNNKSIVNNYGALFDTLLNEKEVLGYVAKVKDQLEISNKELIESNKKLKINSELQLEFINLAAHELRTPTQAIVGYIDMIENYPDDSSDNQNYLKSIMRNANRLVRLVDDLLDVARIESRTMILAKEITNLEHLVNTIVQDFRVDLESKKRIEDNKNDNNNRDDDEVEHRKKKNLEIISTLDLDQVNNKTGFDVMIDRSKISQALSNIIGNSLNSIYRNKKNSDIDSNYVSIIISKSMNHENKKRDDDRIPKENKKNEILVTIKDTGKGIDSEILPRLFTKFATNRYSGTGLGLYITKAIIEAHGGRIWAENNQNERGATFRFTLPLVRTGN